jgi:hypothetical protein
MDHKEQHHQHHQHERDLEKRRVKEHSHEDPGKRKGIHPGWFIGIGVVLILIAIIIWTLVV